MDTDTDLLTSEQRYRLQVALSALRVADALDTLIKFADKEFYTDDDDDLDAHHVSDSAWFQSGLPDTAQSIDDLHEEFSRWARALQKHIHQDLLTDPTNA